MAKKKRKTIKIEIPIPELPSPSRIAKSLDLKKGKKILEEKIPKSADLEEGKKILEEKIPRSFDLEKAKIFLKEKLPRSFDPEKVREFIQLNSKMVGVLVVIIAAIIATSLIYVNLLGLDNLGNGIVPVKVNRTKTIISIEPLNISFDEYIDNYLFYADQTLTLTGFLLLRIEDTPGGGMLGVYAYYLVDDYDKEITLTELNEMERTILINNNATNRLFNVTGQIVTKFGGFDFEVSRITSTDRPTRRVIKQVVVSE